MYRKGKCEEAKVLWLAALEGQRRALGEEHKKTLDSLNNMGAVLQLMTDYEGALDHYHKRLGHLRRSWRRLILTP